MDEKNFMLTTIDNPYNPFDDFVQWNKFDVEKGYNTCCYIARLSNITDDLSQKEIDDENERVIDSIIEQDFLGIYVKIERNSVPKLPLAPQTTI